MGRKLSCHPQPECGMWLVAPHLSFIIKVKVKKKKNRAKLSGFLAHPTKDFIEKKRWVLPVLYQFNCLLMVLMQAWHLGHV